MVTKITISISDELHEAVKAWAERTGGTVSGFFAELAVQRLEADHASRERLAEMTAHDRAADPEGYDRRKAALRERMSNAKRAAGQKKVVTP